VHLWGGFSFFLIGKKKKKRGKYYNFLYIPNRTRVLRGFFGILTTPWRIQFSALEGRLRPKVLALIGLSNAQCGMRVPVVVPGGALFCGVSALLLPGQLLGLLGPSYMLYVLWL
jgi:hypothetical protein